MEEITDEKDVTLAPSSDPKPKLKYDETTQSRVLVDPDFVEYQLPPGAHRLRIKSNACKPVDAKVLLTAGETTPRAVKLEWLVSPEEESARRRAADDQRKKAAYSDRISTESSHRTTGYVVGGLGVASAIGMTAFLVVGNDVTSQLKNGGVPNAGAFQDVSNKGQTYNTAAIVCGVGAALGIGVGVPLVLFNLPSSEPAVSIAPTAGGARFTASFVLP